MTNRKISIVDFIILSIAIAANVIALFYQFIFHELPCPLCLLQRVGLFCIAFGAMMNLKHGKEFKYDLIIIISSIYSVWIKTLIFQQIFKFVTKFKLKFINKIII